MTRRPSPEAYPLIDLHTASLTAVQAMWSVASLDLSQKRPSTQVIAAARSGTSAGAFVPGVPAPVNTEIAVYLPINPNRNKMILSGS